MVTFTIGLGVGGLVPYEADYYATGGSLTTAPSCPTGATCPVYKNIRQGNASWPDPSTATTGNSPSANIASARVDDLWHAAVDGHGRYLSAKDPSSLTNALNATLSAISAQTSSAASAATSNLEPVSGDNFAYVAQYTTALWTGDLLAKTIDLVTGGISAASNWSASDMLASKVYGATSGDGRSIYIFDSSKTNKLNSFPGSLSTSYFDPTKLSQYGSLTSDQKQSATATNLINYIRGQAKYQNNAGNDNGPFRDRSTPLGDIVNSAPVFVRKPPMNYAENGYSTFKSNQASRAGTVYVGANDGMLHAINADTGEERWAYIPTAVIPSLYKLADFSYPTTHQYFVDGTVTVGDVYDGSAWHTVLVGGLGGGGQSYFALDVTDPANPKAMWEFGAALGTSTDPDLGYTYGNPIITKRDSDNRWVVLFTSGYNNTAGDKMGRLYVMDAMTGVKLSEITTDSNTDPNTSGIARISNYVNDSLTDNRTQYVYGGDLGGRLWRFDINNNRSQKLGQTNSTLGNEPITVRPELGIVKDSAGNSYRAVFFGTGRYLGFGDLSTNSTSNTVAQTVFAVKDTGTDLGDLRATSAALVKQTLDSSLTPRTVPNPLPVDWGLKNGWYVDVPTGERFSIDPRLQLGSLILVSNAPKDDYCVVGGSSYFYAFDFKSGTSITGQLGKYVGWQVGNSLATGLTVVRLPTGKLAAIVNESDTTIRSMQPPTSTGTTTGAVRVSWREIE
jgi:type IV pilus assembly protein PilY1